MSVRRGAAILVAIVLVLGTSVLSGAPRPALAATVTLTVTTVADSGTSPLSLRGAIADANADNSGNPVTINFDIASGCNPTSGICVISPISALPTLTRSNVTIDGYGQPGVSAQVAHSNTNTTLSAGSNALILIEIDAGNLPGTDTSILAITGSGVTVEGLDMTGGLQIQSDISLASTASNARVTGNFLGMTPDSNLAGSLNGVMLTGTSGAVVGGLTPAAVNVLSGDGDGVLACGTTGLTIERNLIGPDATGELSLVNPINGFLSNANGIAVDDAATPGDQCPGGSGTSTGTVIGGSGLPTASGGAGNVISGNESGVLLYGGAAHVEGNFIGTDASGTAGMGNSDGIDDNGQSDIIGTAVSGTGNVISGNSTGVAVTGSGATIAGNIIGPDATGAEDIGNGAGVSVSSSDCFGSTCPDPPQNVTIGGTAAGTGNNLNDNGAQGIDLTACKTCVVQGNSIDDGGVGISVGFGFGVTIGGTAAGAGNTITGYLEYGIVVDGSSSSTHVAIQRNIIHGDPPLVLYPFSPTDIVIGAQGNACAAPPADPNNSDLACPVITGETVSGGLVTSISGHAPTNSSVEVYTATNNPGEALQGGSQIYLGTAIANGPTCSPSPCPSGEEQWTLSSPFAGSFSLNQGQAVTATATLAAPGSPGEFDTSQFAHNFATLSAADTTVVTTGDVVHPGLPCDNTAGAFIGTANMTLRCAITEAALFPNGTVTFAIPSSDSGCHAQTIHATSASVCTLSPSTPLPALIGTGTTIDGFSGSPGGAHANTAAFGQPDNSVHTIRLDGTGLASANEPSCVLLAGLDNVIRGLSITNCRDALEFYAGGGVGTTIQGDYLGVEPDGITAAGNGNGVGAASLFGSLGGTNNATIGGTAPADRNIISGNTNGNGLFLNDNSDTVQGNYIGTDATGATALPNGDGIQLLGNSIIVGGAATGAGNVISGNTNAGVHMFVGSSGGLIGNQLLDNRIGTTALGTAALPNADGIDIFGPGGSNNTIGPNNLISGNNGPGVAILGGVDPSNPTGAPALTGTSVQNNTIGLDINGNALGNAGQGIDVNFGAVAVSITGNTIADNTDAGVEVGTSSTDNAQAVIDPNLIHNNGGLAIDLFPLGVTCTGPVSGAPNDDTPCPTGLSVTGTTSDATVSGHACAGCLVEVFVASNGTHEASHGGGSVFLGSTTAGTCTTPPCGGSVAWSITGLTISSGAMVTATATEQNTSTSTKIETSEFSANVSFTPTLALVVGITVTHHAGVRDVRWSIGRQSGLLGFNVLRRGVRVNRQLVAVHARHTYLYVYRGSGHGPFSVQVVKAGS